MKTNKQIDQTLAERMRDFASSCPEHAKELYMLASELEIDDTSNIPRIVGIWARARRRWCEITGEPLI